MFVARLAIKNGASGYSVGLGVEGQSAEVEVGGGLEVLAIAVPAAAPIRGLAGGRILVVPRSYDASVTEEVPPEPQDLSFASAPVCTCSRRCAWRKEPISD